MAEPGLSLECGSTGSMKIQLFYIYINEITLDINVNMVYAGFGITPCTWIKRINNSKELTVDDYFKILLL